MITVDIHILARAAWYIIVILHSLCPTGETISVFIFLHLCTSVYLQLIYSTHSFQIVCRCPWQYSDLNQFHLSHEKRTESSRFTSGLLSILASSSISQTSVCCRHILAYVVTPLPWPNFTKVLFNNKKRTVFFKRNNPLNLFEITITQLRKTFELVIFLTRCKCCTGLQPSSSITALLFPCKLFLFLIFCALLIALWGICVGIDLATSTGESLEANSKGLIF